MVAIATNGDPWQPDHFVCELNRHIIELSDWFYAELRQCNPGVFFATSSKKVTVFDEGDKILRWRAELFLILDIFHSRFEV
ncbi:MAG: hypothetical protein N2V75_05365 [Methanophagales archaeon]|nr:hypothetical protein [Methanophagales archaeon]